MKPILFCIPLKPNCLQQYRNFIADASKSKQQEWKEMFVRYDILSVKVWVKKIADIDYAFVYHTVGPNFDEKIKNWNDSQHPFDQWFNQQIMAFYNSSATEDSATHLLDLAVA